MITEKDVSIELLVLSTKDDKSFHTYQHQRETLLIKISGKNRVTHNGENTIILNNAIKHIVKNTIAKCGFSHRIREHCQDKIEYKANVIRNFYETFKKVEAFPDLLNAKA